MIELSGYLCDIMSKMGFHIWILELIFQCISSVEYLITYGGRELGPIRMGRSISLR